MTALRDHLATGGTTICRAWIVRRRDGLVLGFTDHDGTIEIDGTLCRASSGMTGGTLATSTGLSVDNAEASGALSSDAISEEDIRSGRWDDASIVAYRVNWSDPSQHDVTFRGSLGEIAWADGAFVAELRGVSEALNRPRGRVYQGRCDAVLGDRRCGKTLDQLYRVECRVIEHLGAERIALEVPGVFAQGWFAQGSLVVRSGASEGLGARIKTDRLVEGRREVGLWTSFARPVVGGDRVELIAGCDKRVATCRDKFKNLLNFRGFPHIPGEEWLMAYPVRDGSNDGGRL